jgi:hypothetical protein
MPRQKSILPLQGTVGEINFFKSGDGYRMRAKGGVTKERIATDPRFERTRENGAEFGAAGKAGKVLRISLLTLIETASDKRMISRLVREIFQVFQADQKNPRGSRNMVDGDVTRLEGFEFNAQGSMSTTFFAPYSINIDRVTGECKITVPTFVPTKFVTAPLGSTHFQLVSGASEVDFKNVSFKNDFHSTPEIPWTNAPTNEIVLTNTVSPNSTNPIFLAFGVQYYQLFNGTMYPLKSGAFNALALVKVSKP